MKLLHQLPLLAATSFLTVSASLRPDKLSFDHQQLSGAAPESYDAASSGDEAEASRSRVFQKDEAPASSSTESTANRYDAAKVTERKGRRKDDSKVVEPREEDFIEAADFGIQAMNDLYSIKEPKLYSMGLFLSSNNPARYVAAFNQQTEEAKLLSKFGYASLEAAKQFRNKFPDILRTASFRQSPEKSVLRQQCPRKGVPECLPASLRYRTADGSCNNRDQLWWGSAMSTMQRLLPASYEDNIESIRRSVTGDMLPSARQVSDYIHQERDSPLTSVTHMLMQWGQFIDHDITATGQSSAFNGSVPQCCLNNGQGFQPPEFMHPDCLPIAVHSQDSHLGELGVRCLEFVRSGPAPREDCEIGSREQLSQVTSYIDASTVYSSSARQSDSLRIFRNGLMQYGKIQSRRPVLPRDDSDLCRRGSLSTNCFRAGDGRLSEQPALISLHVVFLRLHNRLATKLSALNQHWSDEKIFQETRKIVAAIVQHITYREFLPIVLGHDVMNIFDLELNRQGHYNGYDKLVNPNIANAFSSAAFRFGHSLVQRSFVRFDRNHQPILNNVTIHEEFSNPANLETAGSVDRILLGLINQAAQKRDEFISEELTNHLFQTPGFPFGMDLASLNVQRGRDHGIPPYVEWRQPCALSPILDWKDLDRVMSSETAKKFRDIYAAVEDIDLFSAGLAEKPVPGGLVGPTFACIIAQQFRNLRKGDRFWYENPFVESGFTLEQLQQIKRVTLAQILCHTMDNIDAIQPFVMLRPDDMRNQRLDCENPILSDINLDPWIERNSKSKRELVDKKGESNQDGDKAVESKTNKDSTEKLEPRSATPRKPSQRVPPQKQNPIRTRINQQNRITVRRPLGPNENLTIIVNNNAVNSPVFVTDSIYGSNLQINKPFNTDQLNYPDHLKPSDLIDGFAHLLPSMDNKPMPFQRPHNHYFTSMNAYYPHNFHDPNNPNPPNYGVSSRPTSSNYPANFGHNNQNTQIYEQHHTDNYSAPKKTTTHTQNLSPSYYSTKKPEHAGYNENVHGEFPSQFTDIYTSNVNRPLQNGYSSQAGSINPYHGQFEPNNSDNDELAKNFKMNLKQVSKSTSPNPHSSERFKVNPTLKKPVPGLPQTWNNLNTDATEYTTSTFQSEQMNNWQSSNNHLNSYTNLKSSNNDFQYNVRNKENMNRDVQGTVSNIRYVPSGELKINENKKIDSELPRPLTFVQNREPENEGFHKSTSKLAFITDSQLEVVSNLKNNKTSSKNLTQKKSH